MSAARRWSTRSSCPRSCAPRWSTRSSRWASCTRAPHATCVYQNARADNHSAYGRPLDICVSRMGAHWTYAYPVWAPIGHMRTRMRRYEDICDAHSPRLDGARFADPFGNNVGVFGFAALKVRASEVCLGRCDVMDHVRVCARASRTGSVNSRACSDAGATGARARAAHEVRRRHELSRVGGGGARGQRGGGVCVRARACVCARATVPNYIYVTRRRVRHAARAQTDTP